jgi:hypothetical protein
MGLTNKTDKLDARGLAILLRNGTLPKYGDGDPPLYRREWTRVNAVGAFLRPCSFSLLYSVSGKATSSATNNVISTFPDPGSS